MDRTGESEDARRTDGEIEMHSPDEVPSTLRGLEVAFTGRFASMSRERARALLVAAGARPATRPGPRTDWLVVGSEGWPLRDDGRPTRALERARELLRAGHPLRIVTEDTWLAAVGLADAPSVIHRLCTATELARLLDLPLARIRQLVRAELIRPARTVHRLDFFAFREVAAARDLARLLERGISVDRIARGLHRVRDWLAPEMRGGIEGTVVAEAPGDGGACSELHPEDTRAASERREHSSAGPPRHLLHTVPGEEGELLVRLEGGALAEVTGQLRLDFVGESATVPPVSPAAPTRVGGSAGGDPRAHFERGQRAEETGDLDGAQRAYLDAIEAGGAFPELHFNLGNILSLLEHPAESVAEYTRALDLDPEYVEAWNNLGNALAELGEIDDAIRAYERALHFAPEYLDPHFNLAETLWDEGRTGEARGHFWIYLRHESSGPWADRARACLAMPADRSAAD